MQLQAHWETDYQESEAVSSGQVKIDYGRPFHEIKAHCMLPSCGVGDCFHAKKKSIQKEPRRAWILVS